jgi:hypothetical protein
LPSDVKVVVVEHSVEQEKEAALCLLPPHRIVREEEDVSSTDGDVNDGRTIRQFLTSGEHSGDEELTLLGESEHDARSRLRRWEECSHEFAHLFRKP